jgi:hypothetical protein
MIDKSERRYFSGNDVYGVVGAVRDTLYRFGIPLDQTGPAQWSGTSSKTSWGTRQKAIVRAEQTPNGFSLDVRFTVDLDSSGILILILCWFFFFPAAIVLCVLAYQDVSRAEQDMLGAVWHPLQHAMIAPNFAPPFGPPAPGWHPNGPP